MPRGPVRGDSPPAGPAPGRAAGRPGPGGRWIAAARAGLLVAGAAHLLAALDHLSHDPRFAGFFLVVGAGQLLLALRLRSSSPPGAVAAPLVATVGLILLYVVSRTVALDLGPHSDRPEDPDLLGTIVVTAEMVAVASLPALLPSRWRPAAVNGLLAVGVAVWLAWFGGLLG